MKKEKEKCATNDELSLTINDRLEKHPQTHTHDVVRPQTHTHVVVI